MKKILLVFVVMLCSALCASASTTVYFQNTGVPVYIQHGAGPKVSIHSIQSNPHYRSMPYRNNFARPYGAPRYARNRYAQPRGIYPVVGDNHIVVGTVPPQPVSNVVNSAPVSRLNKTYQPKAPKRYSRNGMIYYN